MQDDDVLCEYCGEYIHKREARVTLVKKVYHGDCLVAHLRRLNAERKAEAEALASTRG